MRAFGACVLLGMVYMTKTCPDFPASVAGALVAGLIGAGTERWGCTNGYWNWEPGLESLFMIGGSPDGFPLEVVVAYAGAGFWMGSISTRIMAPEHAELAEHIPRPFAMVVLSHMYVAALQLFAVVCAWQQPPFRQSIVLCLLGGTVLANIPPASSSSAACSPRASIICWGLVTGCAGYFFEVYATGGIGRNASIYIYLKRPACSCLPLLRCVVFLRCADPDFAIWRYNMEVLCL